VIRGAHIIIYSRDAAADRAFFRDVLGYRHVDAGDGWLIFALPPAELAFHPVMETERHEFHLMCEDITAFVAAMGQQDVACTPVRHEGWGSITHITLPGGSALGVYEPRHASPLAADPGARRPPAPPAS
jgi:catechol 2,3-dioxygenase-like lactoylglutathione lyase family enzyme